MKEYVTTTAQQGDNILLEINSHLKNLVEKKPTTSN